MYVHLSCLSKKIFLIFVRIFNDYLNLFDTSSSSSNDDSSSDEEFFQLMEEVGNLRKDPQMKNYREKRESVQKYSDIEFERRFRLPKDSFNSLMEKMKNVLEPICRRDKPISVEQQLLITLRYYATANFQIVSGDLFGVSQPSVSRIIQHVSKCVASLAKGVIKFPSDDNEMQNIKHQFYTISGIPNVIGIIAYNNAVIKLYTYFFYRNTYPITVSRTKHGRKI